MKALESWIFCGKYADKLVSFAYKTLTLLHIDHIIVPALKIKRNQDVHEVGRIRTVEYVAECKFFCCHALGEVQPQSFGIEENGAGHTCFSKRANLLISNALA